MKPKEAQRQQEQQAALRRQLRSKNLEDRIRAALALRVEAKRIELGLGYREVAREVDLSVNLVFRACQPSDSKYGRVRLPQLTGLVEWAGGFALAGADPDRGTWADVIDQVRRLELPGPQEQLLLSTIHGFQLGLAAINIELPEAAAAS